MKLYHGTTETVARAALTEGLLPREETGCESNWEECPSRGDVVYLTTAYAPYFAASACSLGERWGLVEVDTDNLDLDDLVPDEDFLEQATRGKRRSLAALGAPNLGDMVLQTKWFRDNLESFGHLWEVSVENLGNCAHIGSIPSEAVTRVSVFDPRERGEIAFGWVDPSITLLNYMVCGARYRATSRWFFDPTTEGDAADLLMLTPPIEELQQKVREVFEDRKGLEVLMR